MVDGVCSAHTTTWQRRRFHCRQIRIFRRVFRFRKTTEPLHRIPIFGTRIQRTDTKTAGSGLLSQTEFETTGRVGDLRKLVAEDYLGLIKTLRDSAHFTLGFKVCQEIVFTVCPH